jgi:CRISPR-associated endonuclease/helicase Cas3
VICAHSANPRGSRHDLVAHLRAVAELAAGFAAEIGAADPAYFLGLWHDLGKFNPVFQAYLLACEANPAGRGHGPDHKAAGSWLATQHPEFGPAALLIHGHHGGLRTRTDFRTWLAERLKDPATRGAIQRAREHMPDLEPTSEVRFPDQVNHDRNAVELFLRLLFSALVDADYLDTERHFREERTAQRGSDMTMATLWERFEADQDRLSGRRANVVGEARHAIYQACLAAAEQPPGLFRLTVPTGGGKTRSAMAFALRHALRHGQRRVIVAVPFISITEQTADVYRDIFGVDSDGRPVILEHHSGAVMDPTADDFHVDRVWTRLAAENWDAPIVVTTTVQLFESLFANGTSPSRKLHRLARSVIVLDEAQALPAHLLAPILDVLKQLCAYYGTTVVISTATQPAFEAIEPFASLPAAEIVPEPGRFFAALRRVVYEWRTDRALAWSEVANVLRDARQALAVLNTKKDALALLEALGDGDALHLSTLLCGAHRRHVIREVRRRLEIGEPCRLVSTQVIEAGVDLDFPMVLRALGPLDGIIQAAGRCNREGRLERGRVVVFQPEGGSLPPGAYRAAAGVTRSLVGNSTLDPDDPSVPRQYFRRLYQTVDTDAEGIQPLRGALNYPEVGRRFRMIKDDTTSVVVAYGATDQQRTVGELVDQLRRGTPNARLILRRLQPYVVGVRTREAERHQQRGLIEPVLPGLGEWLGAYDPILGLSGDDPDPDALVI